LVFFIINYCLKSVFYFFCVKVLYATAFQYFFYIIVVKFRYFLFLIFFYRTLNLIVYIRKCGCIDLVIVYLLHSFLKNLFFILCSHCLFHIEYFFYKMIIQFIRFPCGIKDMIDICSVVRETRK